MRPVAHRDATKHAGTGGVIWIAGTGGVPRHAMFGEITRRAEPGGAVRQMG
jgi:hypothetical protein